MNAATLMSRDPDTPPTIRVARVITRLNIGGPSIQAARLTTALEGHGFSTTLLHGRLGHGEGDMSYLVAPGADARYLPVLCRPLSPLDDLRAFVTLFGELRRIQPHILHTHMAKAGLLARLAAALHNLLRGSAPRARIVHTYHGHVLDGYFSPVTTTVFIALERMLARISDRIVAISPAIRAELLQTYRIGRERQYRVVPLGFDLSPFAAVDANARRAARRALDLPADAPVISTVGRLTAIKQHGLFLDTMQRVHRTHPAAIALIAGDGELRDELVAHARRLGIEDRVRMLGWRRDLATIYAASDVFLLTSRNEGTPVALIEAMASGTPGVSTDVGGVKDVIGGSDTGRTAPFGDADALAGAVHELLADPELRATMGAAARARVLAHYDLNRLVGDIAALYRDMLADG
ncbi:MAG TPA: glycosyltransferase [Vicinamibacterales bacterium]|nr:glycosyltransferase [Vicinamibacterales bacterium]